jgi:hypothetical protein
MIEFNYHDVALLCALNVLLILALGLAMSV